VSGRRSACFAVRARFESLDVLRPWMFCGRAGLTLRWEPSSTFSAARVNFFALSEGSLRVMFLSTSERKHPSLGFPVLVREQAGCSSQDLT
jgi:hypothetical protein